MEVDVAPPASLLVERLSSFRKVTPISCHPRAITARATG